MALSPRAVALVLLGLVPVVIWPSGWTVRLWILGCLLVVGVDLLLAASPAPVGVADRVSLRGSADREGFAEGPKLRAVAEGERDLRAILIDTNQPRGLAPCGACRQVLHEFAPELWVVLVRGDDLHLARLSDYLPDAFGPADLG